MRSRWGIVLMVVALIATLSAVAILAGCPADTPEEDPGDFMPPPDPAMEEPMPGDIDMDTDADVDADGVDADPDADADVEGDAGADVEDVEVAPIDE